MKKLFILLCLILLTGVSLEVKAEKHVNLIYLHGVLTYNTENYTNDRLNLEKDIKKLDKGIDNVGKNSVGVLGHYRIDKVIQHAGYWGDYFAQNQNYATSKYNQSQGLDEQNWGINKIYESRFKSLAFFDMDSSAQNQICDIRRFFHRFFFDVFNYTPDLNKPLVLSEANYNGDDGLRMQILNKLIYQILESDKPVILMGHSFGGIILSDLMMTLYTTPSIKIKVPVTKNFYEKIDGNEIGKYFVFMNRDNKVVISGKLFKDERYFNNQYDNRNEAYNIKENGFKADLDNDYYINNITDFINVNKCDLKDDQGDEITSKCGYVYSKPEKFDRYVYIDALVDNKAILDKIAGIVTYGTQTATVLEKEISEHKIRHEKYLLRKQEALQKGIEIEKPDNVIDGMKTDNKFWINVLHRNDPTAISLPKYFVEESKDDSTENEHIVNAVLHTNPFIKISNGPLLLFIGNFFNKDSIIDAHSWYNSKHEVFIKKLNKIMDESL